MNEMVVWLVLVGLVIWFIQMIWKYNQEYEKDRFIRAAVTPTENERENSAPPTPTYEKTDDLQDEMRIILDNVPPETHPKCKVGDHVKLWKPQGRDVAFVFVRGSVGGQGRIGVIEEYSPVPFHLADGGECDAKIVAVDSVRRQVDISCRLVSRQQTAIRKTTANKMAHEKLTDELSKKYAAKKEIKTDARIELIEQHGLEPGQQLFLERLPISFYLSEQKNLVIGLVNQAGKRVAEISGPKSLVTKVIRADNSALVPSFIFTKTEDPSIQKYLDNIRGEVEVTIPAPIKAVPTTKEGGGL